MGLVKLLFSFNGRINRAQYWTGTAGVSAVNFVITMMTSLSSAMNAASHANPAAAVSAAFGTLGFTLIVGMLACWCGLALQVKRFHDRGRSGWLAAIPFVLLVWIILSLIGSAVSGAPIEKALADLGLPILLVLLVSFAFFIDLGCLPGKPEANKYGDPPGAPPSSGFTPQRPASPNAKPGAAAAASSLFGADAAMARAIVERQTAPAPKPQAAPAMPPRHAVQPAAATAGSTSFGRRPTR